jgi:hypothetical protein
LFACFVAMLVTWMNFASGVRDLRGGALSMLETHIVMSSFIFHLALLHTLFLSSLMYLTITHIFLVHKRTTLSLDALVMVHVLIMVIVSHVGLVFYMRVSHPF